MVDFLKKRLQVFVSSTFTDLKEERQAAVEAILAAGHIPAGMELFSAGDESQMEVIKQWIDESDIYVLILAGRYGSIETNSGKSYTHLEYEYAIGLSKPVFACVASDACVAKRVKKHGITFTEQNSPQKLKEFRDSVLTRVSKFWDDSKDIKIYVGDTVSKLARREDLVGWVRPGGSADVAALADELARLSKENAELRLQVNQPQDGLVGGFHYDDLVALLVAKNLLIPLMQNQQRLSAAYKPGLGADKSWLHALGAIGFVNVVDIERDQYQLSALGREFLMRFELKNLKRGTDTI